MFFPGQCAITQNCYFSTKMSLMTSNTENQGETFKAMPWQGHSIFSLFYRVSGRPVQVLLSFLQLDTMTMRLLDCSVLRLTISWRGPAPHARGPCGKALLPKYLRLVPCLRLAAGLGTLLRGQTSPWHKDKPSPASKTQPRKINTLAWPPLGPRHFSRHGGIYVPCKFPRKLGQVLVGSHLVKSLPC